MYAKETGLSDGVVHAVGDFKVKIDRHKQVPRAARVYLGEFMYKKEDCIFCSPKNERIIAENDIAYGIIDRYPVTPLHTLIIPKRHAPTYFDLEQNELDAIHQLLQEARAFIMNEDEKVSGFNIGTNCGQEAGQSVPHCHIHLIPRRAGDVKNPQGGVRHIIPDKGHYTRTPR